MADHRQLEKADELKSEGAGGFRQQADYLLTTRGHSQPCADLRYQESAGLPDVELVGLSANDYVLAAAKESVGQHMYVAGPVKDGPVDPGVGCAASVSNVIRVAESFQDSQHLHPADEFMNPQTPYDSNVGQLARALKKELGAADVAHGSEKGGDLVIGTGPGKYDQHVGILGDMENGRRIVYHNKSGVWVKDTVDHRFGQYAQLEYVRINSL